MANDEPDFSQLEQPPKVPSRVVSERAPGNFGWIDSPAPNVYPNERPYEVEEGYRYVSKKQRKESKKFSIRRWIQDSKKRYVIIYAFQFVMAFIIFVATIIVFYMINPPLTQNSEGKQNYKAVLVAASIAFIVTFIIPEFFRWIKY